MARDLLIGVDGGGSGCRVAIRAADGRDLSMAKGGAANVSTDRGAALSNIRDTIERAREGAGLDVSANARARVHAGLAGAIDATIEAEVADALRRSEGFAVCTVSDDREIQALGALGGADGYLLAIGTGSIVARVRDGQVVGVGGWGFVLSDQGSGADLGRAALRQALMAIDGIVRHTALTQELLECHGGASGIVAFAARAQPSDFAAVAPLVSQAAKALDANAVSILRDGAAYLDRSLRSLGFSKGDRLCLTGGLGPVYRDWLDAARTARLHDPSGTALDGALQRAGAQT